MDKKKKNSQGLYVEQGGAWSPSRPTEPGMTLNQIAAECNRTHLQYLMLELFRMFKEGWISQEELYKFEKLLFKNDMEG